VAILTIYSLNDDFWRFFKTILSPAYCWRRSSVVCLSVCMSVCWSRSWAMRKTPEPIEMPFRGWLMWVHSNEQCVRWGSRSDESIRRRESWQVGDAAFYQITLDTCYFYLWGKSQFLTTFVSFRTYGTVIMVYGREIAVCTSVGLYSVSRQKTRPHWPLWVLERCHCIRRFIVRYFFHFCLCQLFWSPRCRARKCKHFAALTVRLPIWC